LTEEEVLLLVNTGGGNIRGGELGYWAGNRYQTSGSSSSFRSTIAVNTTAETELSVAPEHLYRSYAQSSNGAGNILSYAIPLLDGDYSIRLHFLDPSYSSADSRVFDIYLQGEQAADNYDIAADAGGRYTATVQSFDFTVSNGEGLLLELINETDPGSLLSGFEILRTNPGGVAETNVDLDISTDGGTSWTLLATDVAINRFGEGSHVWLLEDINSNDVLLRATANDIDATQGTMTDVFSLLLDDNTYYINDSSQTGDQYTSAVGDNANHGLTPDRPMASLRALLDRYDFDESSIIYVDTGTYNLNTNIVLDEALSGITIQGATGIGTQTLLDRSNTSTGSYVFEFAGADDVTLTGLSITGGHDGIYAVSSSQSERAVISNNEIFGNAQRGIYVRSNNDGFVIKENEIYENHYGIDIESPTNFQQVFNNIVHSNYYGIHARSDTWVIGNEVYGNTQGIQGWDTALIESNLVYNQTQMGIYLYGSSTAKNNILYSNREGIHVRGYINKVYGNRLFKNTTGILLEGTASLYNNFV